MEEDQLDDLELDGLITLRILDGSTWDFTQAKWWLWSKTVNCGSLISSCCPRNPHGKAGNEERRRRPKVLKKALGWYDGVRSNVSSNFLCSNFGESALFLGIHPEFCVRNPKCFFVSEIKWRPKKKKKKGLHP